MGRRGHRDHNGLLRKSAKLGERGTSLNQVGVARLDNESVTAWHLGAGGEFYDYTRT